MFLAGILGEDHISYAVVQTRHLFFLQQRGTGSGVLAHFSSRRRQKVGRKHFCRSVEGKNASWMIHCVTRGNSWKINRSSLSLPISVQHRIGANLYGMLYLYRVQHSSVLTSARLY